MRNWLAQLKGLRRYPSMLAGIIVIAIFVAVSICTVIAIPYSQAITLWRGGPDVTATNPKNAAPTWFNLFTSDKLPSTIIVNSAAGAGTKTEQTLGNGMKQVDITLPFKYTANRFPTDLRLYTQLVNSGSSVNMTVSWLTPDGRTVVLQESHPVKASDIYYIAQDAALRAQLSGAAPQVGLLANPQNKSKALDGNYQVMLTAQIPQTATLDSRLVVYGSVYGLAGTDYRGRDLIVPLLWGAPIALMFGLLAAVGTGLLTFVLAAIGTWLGGKVDKAFQWITQVNLIIPLLPVLILVGHFYSRSIFTMLGLVILLSIFGTTMLTNRAMFLQAKEAPYIEAAQAYGARNFRVIFRYLIPRIAPTLLPEFVLIVPTFVFLEATLAVLGLGDPILPTWGKVLDDAYAQGALYKGLYYWFLEPAVLLMVLGVGFSLIGYSLDRVFNPRLRTV
jgi:peptide/nickel transport system permease protein